MGDEEFQWELCKENIQPIKQGRAVDTLMAALDQNSVHLINRKRNEFETELRTYCGPDPLDVWHRYALWVEQSYLKGGKASNLKTLLEKCFVAINSNAEHVNKYRNDPRFLQLWLKYASMCNNALEVLQMLDAKGQCQELAGFYMNWADAMEEAGNMKKADLIYQQGLAKAKDCTLLLKEAHKNFQSRMFHSAMKQKEEEEDNAAAQALAAGDDENHQRGVLSSLRTGQKNRAPIERVGESVRGGAGRVQLGEVAGPSSNIQTRTNVYQDENVAGAEGVFLVPAAPSTSRLPAVSQLDKENRLAPGKWGGKKAPPTVGAPPPPVIPINKINDYVKSSTVVYHDEDVPQPPRHFLPTASNVLKEWKATAVQQQAEDVFPVFVPEPFDPFVQAQYDKHAVYQGTEEFSFEELRALKYYKEEEQKKFKEQQMREEQMKKTQEEQKRIEEAKMKEELERRSQDDMKKKEAELEVMKSMLLKQQEMIDKLLQKQMQQPSPTPQQHQQPSSHSPVADESILQATSSQSRQQMNQTGGANKTVFEDSWLAINKTNTTIMGANASMLPAAQLLEESALEGPVLQTEAATGLQSLPMANLSCLPDTSCLPDISDLSIRLPPTAGIPSPSPSSCGATPASTIPSCPSPARTTCSPPAAPSRGGGLSLRPVGPPSSLADPPASPSAFATPTAAGYERSAAPAPPSTRPKVLATDGFRKPQLNSSDQRSILASPTINTKEAQKMMKEVWSTSLDLSKAPPCAVWDNDVEDADESLMPPPPPALTPMEIYRDPSPPPPSSVSPTPFTIYSDDPNAAPVVVQPRPAGLSARPAGLSARPAGLSVRPAGLSARPAGLSERPAGLSERPAGLSERPAGLSERPAGLSERPAGLSEWPAGPLEATGGSSGEGAASSPAAEPALPPTPPVQDENLPPPDYVQHTVTRPRMGVLQPVLDLPAPHLPPQDKGGELLDQGEQCMELDDLKPLPPPSPSPLDPTAGGNDYTLRLPSNLAAFADLSHVASTPGAWAMSRVPQPQLDGDDFTMALMPGYNRSKFHQQHLQVHEEAPARTPPPPSSAEMPPPHPHGTGPSHQPQLGSAHSLPSNQSHSSSAHQPQLGSSQLLEQMGGVAGGVHEGQLSTIMEGSNELTIKNSTTSSCSGFTTTTRSHHTTHLSEVSVTRPSQQQQQHYSSTIQHSSSSTFQQEQHGSRSGYVADRSSSMAATNCTTSHHHEPAAATTATAAATTATAATPIVPNKTKTKSVGDDSFDPDLLCELLMKTPDAAAHHPSAPPSAAAAAAPPSAAAGPADAAVGASAGESQAPSCVGDLELAGTDIDPFCDDLLQKLLCRVQPPLPARAGFVLSDTKMPVIKIQSQVSLGEELYRVRRLRGQGAYAKVFQASTLDPMNVTLLPPAPGGEGGSEGEDDDEEDESQMVLKVQRPASPWEFYICHELRERLRAAGRPGHLLDSMMRVNRGYFFNNGSVLVSQYHRYGTLLDVLNGYKKKGLTMSEDLAMYFMVEVLMILEALHSCGMVHADIKPDNFMVVAMPQLNCGAGSAEGLFEGRPSALKLIDFGRAIDMRLLPPGTTFTRKVLTEGFTCCEMQDGRPWSYQLDLYGAAATAHTLLWGSYMKVIKKDGRYMPQGNFKRYWQQAAWQSVFSSLLNVPSCSEQPCLASLRLTLQNAFYNAAKYKDFAEKCFEFSTIMKTSH